MTSAKELAPQVPNDPVPGVVTGLPSRQVLRKVPTQTLAIPLVLVDLVVLTASSTIARWGRSNLGFLPDVSDLDRNVAPWSVALIACWLVSLALMGAYQTRLLGAGLLEYRRVGNASVLVAAVAGIGAYLVKYPLSRGFFVLLFLVGVPLLLAGRYALRRGLHAARRRGHLMTQTLVAGELDHLEDLVRVLRRESWLGFTVVGALPSNPQGTHTPSGIPVVGRPDDAPEALRSTGADAVIFAAGSFPRAHLFNAMARQLEDRQAQMIVVPALTDISAERLQVRPVAGMPLVHVEKPRAQHAARRLKRTFDVVGPSVLLVASLPVTLLVALAIKIEDHGPVFFTQTRVGRQGETFTFYKFRSMRADAEALLAALRAENQSDGDILFKMAHDPRVTRVGRFIRRFSIDEIPQFWNVWRGDMSLVGPRPALPSEVQRYDEHVLRRLDVRPGVTGLWQVSGRSDLPWEDTVRLDLYYVDNWSMMQDLTILGRTIKAVLASRGAY